MIIWIGDISKIPFKKKESTNNSNYNYKKTNLNNYNSNQPKGNKLHDYDFEANDLVFSFNINNSSKGKNYINESNGNNKEESHTSIKEKNGGFNTLDYSFELDDKPNSKNTYNLKNQLGTKIINIDKNSNLVKTKEKTKETSGKPMKRQGSQMITIKPKQVANIINFHNKNNSMFKKDGIYANGKSKEKAEMLLRQYSSLNNKINDKNLIKTHENSESLEDCNGKTERTHIPCNIVKKGNSSKIKLKLPINSNKLKFSESAVKKLPTNTIDNMSNQTLIDSLNNQIKNLNQENEKLKLELEEEKKVNRKFKEYAEELLMFSE